MRKWHYPKHKETFSDSYQRYSTDYEWWSDNKVHLENNTTDHTLCGNGLEGAEETNKKINCKNCLDTVKYCVELDKLLKKEN